MKLAGRVDMPYIESKVLQGNLPGDPTERMLPVYLPPGYDDNPTRRYPVIYWLAGHGGSGPWTLNVVPWGESYSERIDRLIRTGAMEPVIMVLPDCFTIFGGAQYINTSALGNYEDYLSDEIIPYVDSHYRTLPTREHRAITGKSSGGYGAMVQAMRHRELYSAMANHSGDIYFEFGYMPEMAKLHANLMRWGGLEEFIKQIPDIKARKKVEFGVIGMLCYGAAFAPNPAAPRGFDMPIDLETGELLEDVWARWLEWDPVRMIDRPEYIDAWRQMNYIYMDCGLWDEFNFQIGTRILSKKLTALGIAHDCELFDDGHPNVQYRLDISFPRLEKAIRG
jgi:S-formylglutathione hydrolase FrmB